MNFPLQRGLLECCGFCVGVAGTVASGMRGRGLLIKSHCVEMPLPTLQLRCSRSLRHSAGSARDMTFPRQGWAWESTRALRWGSLAPRPGLSAPVRVTGGEGPVSCPLANIVFPSSGGAAPSSPGAKSAGTFAPHPALSRCQECPGRGQAGSDHLSPGAEGRGISWELWETKRGTKMSRRLGVSGNWSFILEVRED